MPKINLIKRKKNQIRRRLSGEGIVYLIRIHKNDKDYYLQAADQQTKALTWTPDRDSAMVFHTEAGTQHFVHTYMRSRTDIELVGQRSAHV